MCASRAALLYLSLEKRHRLWGGLLRAVWCGGSGGSSTQRAPQRRLAQGLAPRPAWRAGRPPRLWREAGRGGRPGARPAAKAAAPGGLRHFLAGKDGPARSRPPTPRPAGAGSNRWPRLKRYSPPASLSSPFARRALGRADRNLQKLPAPIRVVGKLARRCDGGSREGSPEAPSRASSAEREGSPSEPPEHHGSTRAYSPVAVALDEVLARP